MGKRNKDFTVFNANDVRADHDLLRIKLNDVDFWNQIFQTTPDYAGRLAIEIVDIIEENFPEVNDLRNVDGRRFFQFVLDAIPRTWSGQQTIPQKTGTANNKQRRIINWFDTQVRPYITRLFSFDDLRNAILTQKAVVVDLSGANMTDSEKALYVSKIGDIVLAEGNRIYPKNKLNLVTVVDEAHIYVPQSVKDVEDPFWIRRSKKTIIEFAKQGRKYGLGLCLADQRITAVDKQAIDMGTYFLGKLKMAGDRVNIKEMFGRDEAEALRTIKKFQFLVIGNASPLENVTAPIAVFDPSKDLDYVAKIHSS